MSTSFKAFLKRSVMRRSAWLGSLTPDGWLWALCARNRYVAYSSMTMILLADFLFSAT
jgi:hypothetical protein